MEQFARKLIDEMGLEESPDEVIENFASWPDRVDPRLVQLMAHLKRAGYRVATLTNTNPLHWSEFTDRLSIAVDELMTDNFPSHETGRLKPDPEAFTGVLEHFGCAPESVVFFDDMESNVEAALRMGINSFHVGGLDDVLSVLIGLGMIPETLKFQRG